MPPAWTKHRPSPSSFCMMKPSPPNRPTPIFLWNAMPTDTPRAAQRNESFWQISVPADRLQIHRDDLARDTARRTTTRCLPLPWLVKTVMNRLSPVRMRLPAPQQRVEHAARLLGAVAEDRLHLDAVGHVHQRAGFGDHRLARIELRPRRTASRCRGSRNRCRARGGPGAIGGVARRGRRPPRAARRTARTPARP